MPIRGLEGGVSLRQTTIIAVRRDGRVAMAGDGQVTNDAEKTIMKKGAVKVRRVYRDQVLTGFAGATADAITLRERFEGKLEQYGGDLLRAAVELAKEWRGDRVLRHLQALMIVADRQRLLVISGAGDVIEPDDGVAAIGSGGAYALAAARALLRHTSLSAADIAREALAIAAEICIYTNDHITVEELGG